MHNLRKIDKVWVSEFLNIVLGEFIETKQNLSILSFLKFNIQMLLYKQMYIYMYVTFSMCH